MCAAGQLETGDVVLEVGPGTGALTTVLLEAGAVIKAIETDARAVAALEDRFAKEIATGQLLIHHADMRELGLAEVASIFNLSPHSYKVIANIPYYLSGQLFRFFLDSEIQPNTIVFLVQKEVAKRICDPNKESLLSLSVKVFGTPTYVKTVGKGHFSPVPAVDSAIIRIVDITRDNFTKLDLKPDHFFAVLRLGLGQKRKQLASNLARQYPKEKVQTALSELNLPPTVRGEDVHLTDWLNIAKLLQQ